MSTVDDQIRAFAQRKQLLNDICKDLSCVLVGSVMRKSLEIGTNLEHEIEELLVMFKTFGRIRAFREWVEICQQPNRSTLRDRPNLNQLLLLINEPGEKAGDPAQLLQ